MNEGRVSIVVPCYNYEKYIGRFFQSILGQTYKDIEVIVIDDGSTDDSKKEILKYTSAFEKNGMILKYIFQENAGLGAAIDAGLKHVSGEYLCWADPDDFYYSESIEKRVHALMQHPDYAIVSSDANVLDENDLVNPIKREAARFERRFEENQFELLLTEQSHFCAGCHMVRMTCFDEVNPTRSIYPARRGQNWQMLLPIYYRYKRLYIDEPLYAYVIYSNSMSRGDTTEEKELARWSEHEEIIRKTLSTIPLSDAEKRKYEVLIKVRYATKRFYTAIDFRDKELMDEQFAELKKYNGDSESIKIAYSRNRNVLCKLFYRLKDYV